MAGGRRNITPPFCHGEGTALELRGPSHATSLLENDENCAFWAQGDNSARSMSLLLLRLTCFNKQPHAHHPAKGGLKGQPSASSHGSIVWGKQGPTSRRDAR